MSERYAKHKYDIKKRPDNNDLASHCHKDHDIERDLEVFIIEHDIQNLEKRKRCEDKYICKLQTLAGTGMNSDIGAYAKEMYACWTSTLKAWRQIFVTSNISWTNTQHCFEQYLSSIPLNICYVVRKFHSWKWLYGVETSNYHVFFNWKFLPAKLCTFKVVLSRGHFIQKRDQDIFLAKKGGT